MFALLWWDAIYCLSTYCLLISFTPPANKQECQISTLSVPLGANPSPLILVALQGPLCSSACHDPCRDIPAARSTHFRMVPTKDKFFWHQVILASNAACEVHLVTIAPLVYCRVQCSALPTANITSTPLEGLQSSYRPSCLFSSRQWLSWTQVTWPCVLCWSNRTTGHAAQGAAAQMFERHAHASTAMRDRLPSVSASATAAAPSEASGGGSSFDPAFVAAFGQANVGDTSPNTQGAFCQDTGEDSQLSSRDCTHVV